VMPATTFRFVWPVHDGDGTAGTCATPTTKTSAAFASNEVEFVRADTIRAADVEQALVASGGRKAAERATSASSSVLSPVPTVAKLGTYPVRGRHRVELHPRTHLGARRR
jgi:hypothetical protein